MHLSHLIANGWNVHVGCHKLGCRRVRIMSAQELHDELGDLTLEDLKSRLRCKCGERPGDVVPRNEGTRSAIRG